VAPLLHIINFNNLCFRVENETTLISAKNRVDLSSISEVRSYITEWPRFLGHPVYTVLGEDFYMHSNICLAADGSARLAAISLTFVYRYVPGT